MRRPLFMVCLCLVAIAAVRLWLYDFPDTDVPVDGKIVAVTGRVIQKDTQSFIIQVVSLSDAANLRQNIPFDENLICEYAEASETATDAANGGTSAKQERVCPRIGSMVSLQGLFRSFSEATNPGEFDAAMYYRTLGIGGKITDVRVVAQNEEYLVWRELLYQLRTYLINRLYSVFPQKEASVLAAILIGDKEELDKDVKDLYKENGIIHILSISGLHITMIGMSIYRLLRRFGVPVWLAAVCGGIILCLYGVMTGLSVSACRAIGMYLIRMLAEVVGRTYDMLTALAVMAAIMVCQNPLNLCHAGFLLSFGSVLGIGWFYPALLPEEKRNSPGRYEPQKWKRILSSLWCRQRRKLIQSITAGASITLFTLPIQLWFYYEVPTYSVFLNLLILPFMTPLMMTGLVAMFVPGTGIIGTITCLILQGYEYLCEHFQQLPFHTWNPGQPEISQIIVYYLLLLLVVYRKKVFRVLWRKKAFPMQWRRKAFPVKCRRNSLVWITKKILCAGEQPGKINEGVAEHKEFVKCHKRKGKAAKLEENGGSYVWNLGILTLSVILLTSHINSVTTVTFLDVGQGDCIVIELASGENFLFDCGSSNRSQVGKYVLLPFLKSKGIRQLDAVFVSHPDEDHSNGIIELLGFAQEEGINASQLVLPHIAKTLQDEQFAPLWKAAENTEIAGENLLFEGKCTVKQQVEQQVKQQGGIPVTYISTGDTFEIQGVTFLCLHPPKGYGQEDANVYSLCFYMDIVDGEFSALLTGDIEGDGEELLLQELKNHQLDDVTVLKVPHHGSKNSTGEAFLKQVQPRLAVISCGRNNSYGHPHAETVNRLERTGSTILTTSEYGAVTVEIEKEILVRSWLNPN